MNYKLMISSEEESKRVQEHLFSLGISWVGNRGCNVAHLNEPYLFIEYNGLTFSSDCEWFLNHNAKYLPVHILLLCTKEDLDNGAYDEEAYKLIGQEVNFQAPCLNKHIDSLAMVFPVTRNLQYESDSGVHWSNCKPITPKVEVTQNLRVMKDGKSIDLSTLSDESILALVRA